MAHIQQVFLTALGLDVISYQEALELSELCRKQVELQRPIPLPEHLWAAADRVFLLEQEAAKTLH